MGDMRTNWQNFKKKYPEFEKSKLFKSDVGPQADKFEAAVSECQKLAEALDKKLDERDAIGNSLKSALKGYKAVMLDLKKADPKKMGSIEADCSIDLDGNKAGLPLARVIDKMKDKRHFNFTL